MTKFIVTMPVETRVAMVIEAETEEMAAEEAERLAKANQVEFLHRFTDPLDFIEFPLTPSVDGIHCAAEMGYENAPPANRS